MKLGPTFSPSPLAGCLVALEKVGEPAADTGLLEPTRAGGPWCTAPDTRITAAMTARGDAGQHSWSNARGKLPASNRHAISRNGVSREKSAGSASKLPRWRLLARRSTAFTGEGTLGGHYSESWLGNSERTASPADLTERQQTLQVSRRAILSIQGRPAILRVPILGQYRRIQRSSR